MGEVAAGEEVAGAGAGAGGDSAAQTGAVGDSHEKVGSSVGLSYRGVLEAQNGECGFLCPPRSNFGLNIT